jgi:hypothetical protein
MFASGTHTKTPAMHVTHERHFPERLVLKTPKGLFHAFGHSGATAADNAERARSPRSTARGCGVCLSGKRELEPVE